MRPRVIFYSAKDTVLKKEMQCQSDWEFGGPFS